jgi:hypothetical protein
MICRSARTTLLKADYSRPLVAMSLFFARKLRALFNKSIHWTVSQQAADQE